MKKTMKRIALAFLVLLVSVLSLTALLVSSSATDADTDGEVSSAISITSEGVSVVYEDGSIAIRIDADKLADILESRELSKEEILSFVPDLLLTLVKDRDTSVIQDFLADHLDIKLLTDLISVEVLADYLTPSFLLSIVDEETLERYVDTEKIFDLLDTDDILTVIDEEELIAILSDKEIFEQLMKDDVIDALFDSEQGKEALVDLLTDDVIDQILTKEFKLSLVKNSEFIDDLKELEVLRLLVDDEDLEGVLDQLDPQALREHLSDDELKILLNDDAIKELFEDETLVDTLMGDDVWNRVLTENALESIVTEGFLDSVMDDAFILDLDIAILRKLATDEEIESVLTDEEKQNFADDLTVQQILDLVGKDRLRTIVSAEDVRTHVPKDFLRKHISLQTLRASVDDMTIFKAVDFTFAVNTIGAERICRAVDPELLLDYAGYENVFELVGADLLFTLVDSNEIITYVPASVLSKYVPLERVQEVVPYETIIHELDLAYCIDTVGIDRIVEVVGFSKILELIDMPKFIEIVSYEELFENIDLPGIIRAADRTVLLKQGRALFLDFLFGEIETVELNGRTVYADYKLSLESLQQALLLIMPDTLARMEQAVEAGSDGILAELTLSTVLRDEPLTIGVTVGFSGDATRLASYVKRVLSQVDLTVSEEDCALDLTLTVPSQIVRLLGRALESENIPDELKIKLYSMTDKQIFDLPQLLEQLTVEELETIVNEIDQEKLQGLADKAISSDRLVTYLEKFKSVMSRVFDRLPENAKTLKLSSFYRGNGAFNFETERSVDVYELALSKSDKVAILEDFICDTEISQSVNLTLKFEDFYQASFVADGELLFTTYLPVGADLTMIEEIDLLRDYTGWEDEYNVEITEMPAHDIVLFHSETLHVTFVADGQIVSVLTYEEGDTIDEPDVPTKEHYTGKWDEYEHLLGVQDNVVVHAIYTPITYELTFVDENNNQCGDKVQYTVETEEITYPALPTKDHYTVAWPSVDLTKGGNRTIKAVYTPIDYTLTFYNQENQPVGTVNYTVRDTLDAIEKRIRAKIGDPEQDRKYYEAKWDLPSFAEIDHYNIYIRYDAITYSVKFGDSQTIDYTLEDMLDDDLSDEELLEIVKSFVKSKLEPYTPSSDLAHYEIVWDLRDFQLGKDNEVSTRYQAIKYTIIIVIGDQTYEVSYKKDDVETDTDEEVLEKIKDAIGEKKPDQKDHYTREWDYGNFNYGDTELKVIETPIVYNFIVVIAGVEYKVSYNIGNEEIDTKEEVLKKIKDAIGEKKPDQKDHYTREWDYGNFNYGDTELKVIETPIVYNFIVIIAGVEYKVSYNIGDEETDTLKEVLEKIKATVPDKPAQKDHYTREWNYDSFEYGHEVLAVTQKAIVYNFSLNVAGQSYTVSYNMDEEADIDAVIAKIKDEIPAEPEQRKHYTRVWDFESFAYGHQTLGFIETAITYYLTFTVEGVTYGTPVPYTVEDTHMTVTLPKVPYRAHFTGRWVLQELPAENMTLSIGLLPMGVTNAVANSSQDIDLQEGGNRTYVAVYDPIEYTLTFPDGTVITYTVESKLEDLDLPEPVQDWEHHVAKWPTIDLTLGGNRIIDPIYSLREYTITFVIDGQPVKELTYNVETTSLELPPIPEREGYTAEWPPINFKEGGDRTVEAVYTPISDEPSDEPTDEPTEEPSDAPSGDGTDSSTEEDTSQGTTDGSGGDGSDDRPKDDDDMPWYMIVLWIILVLLLIGIVILIIMRRDPDDEDGEAEEPSNEEGEDEVGEPETMPIPEEITPEEPTVIEPSEPIAESPKQVLISTPAIRTEGKKSYINLSVLNEYFEDGDAVTLQALKYKNLLPARIQRVKVIGNSGLEKRLVVHAHAYSAQAQAKIILLGGEAHIVP